MLAQQGIPPCIPPRRCRKKPVHYSKRLDRKGHKIETLFIPIEGLAAYCNPLRLLRPRLPFCHPPGRHRPLLVMSPDPKESLENPKGTPAFPLQRSGGG